MDPIFGISLAFVAVWYIVQWSYRATVTSWAVRDWKQSGFTVECGPVEVRCYGSDPGESYMKAEPQYGALAILNNRFGFATRRYENFLVPFDAIRWIGYVNARVKRSIGYPDVELLIIHCVYGRQWHVYAFDSENTREIAQELSRRCMLDIVEMGRQRESYGPTDAIRVLQDIYGHWQPYGQGALYLAPDRLLFSTLKQEYGESLSLTKIQGVSAQTNPSILHDLNPFSADLLRVESQSASDTKPQVVGFLVHDAESWAYALQARGVANVTVQTGRKKKDEKEKSEAIVALISKIEDM